MPSQMILYHSRLYCLCTYCISGQSLLYTITWASGWRCATTSQTVTDFTTKLTRPLIKLKTWEGLGMRLKWHQYRCCIMHIQTCMLNRFHCEQCYPAHMRKG